MIADRGSNKTRLEDRRPARVGIILESTVVPQWVARIVSEIVVETYADLQLILLVEREAAGAQDVGGVSLARAARGALWRVYQRLDYRMRRTVPDALEPADINDLVAGRPVIEVPLGAGSSEWLDSKAGHELKDAQLDVILDLATVADQSPLARAARHGIWTLQHGDDRLSDGSPFFWDIYFGDPITVATLEKSSGPSATRRILYRSQGATDLTSLYRSRNSTYWKSAQFPLRRLRDLNERGASYLDARSTASEPQSREQRRDRDPSNFEMLIYFSRLVARSIPKKLAHRFRRFQWFLVYGERHDAFDSDSDQSFYAVFPDHDRFYADPFLVEYEGKDYLFFEDYEYAKEKAVISYIEIGEEQRSIQPRQALERPYHLSYPFIFRLDGVMYMLPETAEARRVELYRAETFPDRWILDRVLIENATVLDSTLIVRDDTIWLFASIPAFGARDTDELHVYSATSLEGEWIAHPMNPVVSDVRRARPAGRIFEHDGFLVRPGQDSSKTYGYGVVLNRIEVLTHDDYSEQEIARIDAAWLEGNRATHTYNSNSRYEVVDAQRLVSRSPRSRVRRSNQHASSLEPLFAGKRRYLLNRPCAVRRRPLLSAACASPMRIEECGSDLTRGMN